MRREHRLDQHPLEQRDDLRRADARGGQLLSSGREAPFLGIGSPAQIVAPAPDAMNALCEIDDLEVRGERADQRFGIARRQALDQGIELVPARGDRGTAGALHELEELLATLLAQYITDESPQRADVIAQRDIFRRELDFASRAAQEPSAGVNSRAAPTPHAAISTLALPSEPIAIGSPFCSTMFVRRASLNA